MNELEDIPPTLRQAYSRLAAWVCRTNRPPAHARTMEPNRHPENPRTIVPGRQSEPDRPD